MTAHSSQGRSPLPLLIDTDTASDDAVAILVAALSGLADIQAITTVAGNVDVHQATRNALYTLELCGAADVPVFVGCDRPLLRARRDAVAVHGADGMSDSDLPVPQLRPEPAHAVDALRRIVSEHAEGTLTLVTLGPLTTIAAAILMDRDFLSRFAQVFCMLGSADMVGNVAPTAEYNAWADPEAAAIVLAHSGAANVTLIGCDVSVQDALIDEAAQEQLRSIGTPAALFADRINQSVAAWMRTELGAEGYDLPDPIAMAVALDPTLVVSDEVAHVSVSTDAQTAGQLVVDRRLVSAPPNVRLVRRADGARFREMLFAACRSHRPSLS